MLDEIVEAARRLCNGEHAQLYMAEGDLFVIFAENSDLPAAYEYSVQHPHAADRSTAIGRVALTGEAVQIPDVLVDPEYSYGAQAIVGYRALLGVPIVLDEELIGGIVVGRDVPGAFADEQVELVMKFADQAAIAIANAIASPDRQAAKSSSKAEMSGILCPSRYTALSTITARRGTCPVRVARSDHAWRGERRSPVRGPWQRSGDEDLCRVARTVFSKPA